VAEPGNRSPNPRPAADVSANLLLGRVMEFCRLLKRAGFNVTPARIVDAFRSLQYVQLGRREDFRVALRVNLTSNHEEEEVFDRLFAEFWRSEGRENEQPRKLESKSIIQDTDYEYREQPTGSPLQYSREELLRTKDLSAEWPGESAGMKPVIRQLVRRLATRPSRRFVAGRKGRRIDLRRSLRHNINHGVDILELCRVRRKIRKTRVALLCDVSGSMDTYNPFLLRLMFGLQKACKSSRTAVFSTRTTEITKALRRHTVPEALDEVARLAQDWSGGTDLGGALAHLNRVVLREGTASSTVGVIISDGYDQGNPETVREEMRALRRRTRSILWINPLIGTEGFAPVARGMAAALPYIDYFLPANDLPTLRALCQTLSKA
jgi:uncharacterized protein with von Willebrand factor type A (vWA) domain